MTKRALLIGSNYTATPAVQLNGCINDIVNVRNTLIDAYGYQDSNILVLRDDDNRRLPTKANIMRLLSQLVAISNQSDMLWVHYSGHGTQIRDRNGDEADGMDECIVPCNYNVAGVITDDEIYAVLNNAKCQMMICFDSCNSGTGCDLQYLTNYNNGSLVKSVNSARSVANPNLIMMSGCRDPQTSADAYDTISKRGVGAFTQTLLETLRANDHNMDILPLYSKVCANLKSYGFTQIPVLSSSAFVPVFKFARVNAYGALVESSSSTAAKTTGSKLVSTYINGKKIMINPALPPSLPRSGSLSMTLLPASKTETNQHPYINGALSSKGKLPLAVNTKSSLSLIPLSGILPMRGRMPELINNN